MANRRIFRQLYNSYNACYKVTNGKEIIALFWNSRSDLILWRDACSRAIRWYEIAPHEQTELANYDKVEN